MEDDWSISEINLNVWCKNVSYKQKTFIHEKKKKNGMQFTTKSCGLRTAVEVSLSPQSLSIKRPF